MHLGVVTSEKCRQLTVSEQALLPLFEKQGVTATPVVWNDPLVPWSTFDALLIRSIWDYHLYPEVFAAWLDMLEQRGVKTWNSIPVLFRNYHKFYLRDLEDRGVRIIPTLFLNKNAADAIEVVIRQGWKKGVVKPAVSASAYRTETFSTAVIEEAEATIQDAASHGDYLIQEFIPEVSLNDELSMIFFNHRYSHAVLKRPQPGEFRVQKEFGGGVVACQPDKHIIQTAESILMHFGDDLLYARVDGIVVDDEFVLMELELIEPDLFLETSVGAHARLVDSLLSRLSAKI